MGCAHSACIPLPLQLVLAHEPQMNRQGAGFEKLGESLRFLHREAAPDDCPAIENRLSDAWSAEHLAIQKYGQDLADIPPGEIGEPLLAFGSELQGDNGLCSTFPFLT